MPGFSRDRILSLNKSAMLLGMLAVSLVPGLVAAEPGDDPELEDLLQTEVTSVSRKSQSLADVPAAAFVISAEDIRRSGATALPDVLRMVPGIEVAQISTARYAVSARGFNGRFANKLQVLVDGRSIYHPIFSGILWEHEQIALEDIERIEVMRGPGAAMWGVNAVNGVINIISRHSRKLAGGEVAATLGSNAGGSLYARQAGNPDERSSWKLSVKGRHAEPSTQFASRAESEDRLNSGLVDFRFDKDLGESRDFSVWANSSRSTLGDLRRAEASFSPFSIGPLAFQQTVGSSSLIGRYRWLSASGVESSAQMALTESSLAVSNFLEEARTTFDLDYQGRYSVLAHDLLWGFSHRTSADSITTNPRRVSFARDEFTQRTSGVFVHDDWTLIPERLVLGLGARWDSTNLGGETFAPSASLLWTPSRTDTLWAKYARAPRMPARAENDVNIIASIVPPAGARPPILIRSNASNSALQPERLEGVELGYRKQFAADLSADIALFRYRYTHLRSGTLTTQDFSNFPTYIVQNTAACSCQAGWSTGVELSADWLALPAWRLQLSYSWLRLAIDDSNLPSLQASGDVIEKSGPRHYGALRSQWNISATRQFDLWLRGSAGYERINAPYPDLAHVPGYATVDLRFGQKLNENTELALSGRNLVGPRRIEYISDYLASVPVEIGPSALLSLRWRF